MQKHGTRIGIKEFGQKHYWANAIADHLIRCNPDRKEFICASGISPSGKIHFGNFREVITTFAVVQALRERGKRAKFIYSWDNFDRFRKVPSGLDESYSEHIGKALSAIPSPTEKSRSYAEVHQKEFESSLKQFNIDAEFKDQTRLYKEGTYDKHIFEALRKRKEIADILLSFMTEKGKKEKNIIDSEYREAYYPITIYSRFTDKDATDILSYDGETTIRYRCKITRKEEEVDLSKTHIAKLSWKVDWAMRWKYERVLFEPGGGDHAAPNGSYDTSSEIAKKIFNYEPPVFTEYGFVGIQGLGTKMSSSSGKNITPKQLLTIYEPHLLMWMYMRRLPTQTFSLALDTEVYRQYDEIDKVFSTPKRNIFTRLFTKNKPATDTIEQEIATTLKKLYPSRLYTNPIPFRQITGLAQIVQWDKTKLNELLKATKLNFDRQSVKARLPKAKAWVTEYNKDAVITIRETPNTDEWNTIDKINKHYISSLHTYLRDNKNATVQDLEAYLYSLPKKDHTDEKELKKAQRDLFKHLYRLLITKNAGPRLGTFLWALPREVTLKLFTK